MILAALVFSGCQVLVFTCICLAARHWYHQELARIRAEISEGIRDFVTAPDENTPSPLAVVADSVSLLLAARLMQQVKAMLAGVESGASKGEQLAMITDAAESSPVIAFLANILPKRIRNQLLKNPQMIGALAKLGGGSSGNHHESVGPTSGPKSFSL
jgi:hypothetical protein